MFAKFSPDGHARGLRAREQPLRRADRRWRDHAADHRRIGDDHQRHVRLGLRGGARSRATRSAGVPTARAIAYWQFDSTGVGIFSLINNTDSLYPAVTHDPLSEGRHHQLRRADRRGARGRAARRSGCRPRAIRVRTTSRALEWIDKRTARDSAVEPAAEPERLAARRCRYAARSRRVFRDESKTWVDVVDERASGLTTAARSCGSASATAGATSTVCRGRGRRRQNAKRRSAADHALRRATSSSSSASTRPAAGSMSPPRPTTRRSAICIASTTRRHRHARAGHTARSARHAHLRAGAGRASWRSTPTRASTCRQSTDVIELPAHAALRTLTDTGGARGEGGAAGHAAGRVLHRRTSAMA